MHVFGPFERFPVADAGAYAPPAADREMQRAVLDRLGFDHALLIQPSLYGTDHRALLDALEANGGRLRAIGSCDRSAGGEALAMLQAQGVVGLRFVGMKGPGGGPYPGTQGLDVFSDLRSDMAVLGMHAQVWAELDTCTDLALSAASLDMPVVFDHLAGLSPGDLPGSYRFDRLADALASGSVWIKLTYLRRSGMPLDYGDMQAVVSSLAEVVPDRIIWGSDWPFVRMDARPDPGVLLDQLRGWLGDDVFTRCVRDNPTRLLGVGKTR
jgi:predicted TIM-barrel fold metal-dependent hydrolase